MESIRLSLPNNDGHSVSLWSGYPTRKTMTRFIPLVIIEIALASAFSEVYNGPGIFIFGIVAFGLLFLLVQSWPCPRCDVT